MNERVPFHEVADVIADAIRLAKGKARPDGGGNADPDYLAGVILGRFMQTGYVVGRLTDAEREAEP